MRDARVWIPVSAALVCAVLAPPRPARGQPQVEGAQQDPNAARVITDARTAMGGEQKLSAIKTLVVTGRTRQVRGDNLVPIEFEIQAELPDKFARRDEFPAQDSGPTVTGFNGDRLVQSPAPPQQPEAAVRAQIVNAKQEFARLMLGVFAASYPSYPLTFAYVGQAEAPQGRADVIDVKGPGDFAARLFVDAKSHLPIMLSWQARQPPPRGRGPGGPGRPGGPPPGVPPPGAAPPTVGTPPPPVENRLYFAGYRAFDGLQLPTRVRRAVAGDTTEETTFDRFRINARVDPRRFEPGS